MIYELPTKKYGQNAVQFYEVLVTPNESVKLTGTLGKVNAAGEFTAAADPMIGRPGGVVRTIAGDEFEAFIEYVDSQRPGSPALGSSTFRKEDLGYWLTIHGWRDDLNTWTPPEA